MVQTSLSLSSTSAAALALVSGAALLVLSGVKVEQEAMAADGLRMRAGVSFTQDIDNGFPIVGSNMDDVSLPSGKPALLFFGASGDLNTNRQAKRVVDLYKKIPASALKFIIIDVDHPANEEARKLIRSYYKDNEYIPLQVILDKTGKLFWSHNGEVETSAVRDQIDKVIE